MKTATTEGYLIYFVLSEAVSNTQERISVLAFILNICCSSFLHQTDVKLMQFWHYFGFLQQTPTASIIPKFQLPHSNFSGHNAQDDGADKCQKKSNNKYLFLQIATNKAFLIFGWHWKIWYVSVHTANHRHITYFDGWSRDLLNYPKVSRYLDAIYNDCSSRSVFTFCDAEHCFIFSVRPNKSLRFWRSVKIKNWTKSTMQNCHSLACM